MSFKIARLSIVLSVMLVAMSPASAASKADKALESAALAQSYAEKCKSMKVNWFTYTTLLEDAGIDVDKLQSGPQFEKLVEYLDSAGTALKQVTEKEVCRRAQAAFGAKGTRVPGLLSDGLAVKGVNKLFDWLHSKGL